MIMLNVLLKCPDCVGRDDSQPNYCRKCGGRGKLKATISEIELPALAEIPQILGAWTETTKEAR